MAKTWLFQPGRLPQTMRWALVGCAILALGQRPAVADPPPSRQLPKPPAPVDASPRPIASPAPVYPPEALRLRQSGTVIVRVGLDANGKLTAISLHQSSGVVILDGAALRAVLSCKFAPAIRNGRPTAAEALVPVVFDLAEKKPAASGKGAAGKKP